MKGSNNETQSSPWDAVGTSNSIDLTKLKFRSCETKDKDRIKEKPKAKDQNYETFNYLPENFREQIKASNHSFTNDSENTLLNILVRSQVRKENRKKLEQNWQVERLKNHKAKLEEEKKRYIKEKDEHEEKLVRLKKEYILKKEREEERKKIELVFLRLTGIAKKHHEKILLRKYFSHMKNLLAIKRRKEIKGRRHYEMKIITNSFRKLRLNHEENIARRNKMAQTTYEFGLMQKYFKFLKEMRDHRWRQVETACAFWSQRKLAQVFSEWRLMAQHSTIVYRSKMDEAKQHYEWKLLYRGFRALRVWLQQKEQRFRRRFFRGRLRGLAKTVLPDYSPLSSDDEGEEREVLNRTILGPEEMTARHEISSVCRKERIYEGL